MGVRIFLSIGSGNKEIENSQQVIQMVLTTRAIEFVTIDISAPGMQEMRRFMREKGKKREGQRNVLPPQIFNGEELRGDFEGFDIANEDDDLEEFLGIPRKNPKADPVKTGAVACDVGKLEPDKLVQDEEIYDTGKEITDAQNEIFDTLPSEKNDTEIQEVLEDDIEYEDENPEYGNNEHGTNGDGTDDEDQNEEADNQNTEELGGNILENNKYSSEEDSVSDKLDKGGSKNDNFTGNIMEEIIIDNNDKHPQLTLSDDLEDSSDCSSDEDTAVEYMPDGELVRKKSRGFKQLSNCKRFWKASLN